MAKLRISPEAQSDLRGIKEYISTDLASPDAAANTVFRIMKAIRRLRKFPDSGAPLSSVVSIPKRLHAVILVF